MARPKGSKNKTTKAKPEKPAKAKPKAAARAAAPEPVKGSEVTGMITKNALNDILKLDKRTKTEQAALAGDLGSMIAKAVERFGTNRKALGLIRSLNRMENEKVADFLDHLDYMLDVSGIEDRAASVQRLPMDSGTDEAEDGEAGAGEPQEAATEADDDKVSRPAFGRPAEVA